MATKTLTSAEFEELNAASGITLIDFWAEWCAPCRQFAPIFQKASEKHPDITFAKVDTEAEQELAMAFGISSIPTVVAIRDSVIVFQQPGAMPEAMLEKLIDKVRELDMEKVKAEVA